MSYSGSDIIVNSELQRCDLCVPHWKVLSVYIPKYCVLLHHHPQQTQHTHTRTAVYSHTVFILPTKSMADFFYLFTLNLQCTLHKGHSSYMTLIWQANSSLCSVTHNTQWLIKTSHFPKWTLSLGSQVCHTFYYNLYQFLDSFFCYWKMQAFWVKCCFKRINLRLNSIYEDYLTQKHLQKKAVHMELQQQVSFRRFTQTVLKTPSDKVSSQRKIRQYIST